MLSIAAHHSVSSEGFKFFFFFVSTLLRGFAFTLIDREQGGAGRGRAGSSLPVPGPYI